MTEELPEYVFETLAAPRLKSVERHLKTCAACSAKVRSLRQAAGGLALSVPAVAAPLGALDRIRGELSGGGRFGHFTPQVAELFDLPARDVRPLFDKLLIPSSWEEGPAPGIGMIPVNAGPKHAGAFSAFVKIPTGVLFPKHRHVGLEVNLVIQGGFRERGKEVWRGDLVREASGTSHDQLGLPGIDCIVAAVLHGHIEMARAPRK